MRTIFSGIFLGCGYRGLYGGLSAKDIHRHKRLKKVASRERKRLKDTTKTLPKMKGKAE